MSLRSVLVDAPWTPGLPGLVNVLHSPVTGAPFADIQDAIDYVNALTDKGRVYVPSGTYADDTLPAFTGINVPRGVSVIGDGDECTTLDMTGQDPDLDCVTLSGKRATVANLAIRGQAVAGDGAGVRITPAALLQNPTLDTVRIYLTPSWGIAVDDGFDVVRPTFYNSRVESVQSNGAIYLGKDTYMATVRDCNLTPYAATDAVVWIDGAQMTLLDACTIEPVSDVPGVKITPSTSYPRRTNVRNCWFEFHAATAASWMFEFEGVGQVPGLSVSGCKLVRTQTDVPLRVWRSRLTGGIASGVMFEQNTYEERRTGAAPTDDFKFSGSGQDALQLVGDGRIFNIADASYRQLSVDGSLLLSFQRIGDAGRFDLPDYSTVNLPSDARNGELAYNTTTDRVNAKTLGGWGIAGFNP